jgi:hypothetical protein
MRVRVSERPAPSPKIELTPFPISFQQTNTEVTECPLGRLHSLVGALFFVCSLLHLDMLKKSIHVILQPRGAGFLRKL